MNFRWRLAITCNVESNKLGFLTSELKAGVAIINIRGYIGGSQVNADAISVLVDDFLAKDIKSCRVNLSSGGGSVWEANDIVSELERFESVKVYVGAVAASAATRFLTRFKSEAKANSQFMIHKPSAGFSGNETTVEKDLKKLKDVTSEYKAAYAAQMGKTPEEIEAMWANGDYWMTAKEALKNKLIGSISGEKIAIDEQTKAMLVACGAPNTSISGSKNNNSTKTMDREQLIAWLGLEPTATDAEIEAAAKAKNVKHTKPDTMDKNQLRASLGLDADASEELVAKTIADNKKAADDAKKAAKTASEQLTAKAEQVVDAAIKAKKIAATQKDNFVKMYLASPEDCSAALEALPVREKLSTETLPGANADTEVARAAWTLETYLEKDPTALATMETSDPTRFKKLNDDYYGS